jgi:hypothetical protein
MSLDRSWNATNHGLKVTQWNNISMSFSLDETMLAVGNIKLEIGDENGELDALFFGTDAFNSTVLKTPDVSILFNGRVYGGNVIEDSTNSVQETKRITIEIKPQTDIINKKMVYRDNNIPINPLHFPIDPAGLSSTASVPIGVMLEKIYQLVNPDINIADNSLQIVHDWTFKGLGDTDTGVAGWLDDIKFHELEILPDALFKYNYLGVSTLGDILKNLTLDFGAFTGMFSKDRAFFKKLFYYDGSNTQTMTVTKWEKNYKFGLIDYISYICGFYSDDGLLGDANNPYEQGIFTSLTDRTISRSGYTCFFVTPNFSPGSDTNTFFNWHIGDFSHFTGQKYYTFDHGSTISPYPAELDIWTNNGSNFQVVGIPIGASRYVVMKRITGTNDPEASGSLTGGMSPITYTGWADPSTGYYYIAQGRDPAIESNAWQNYGDLVTKFWYQYRGNIQNCRVDKFTLLGCNYDFLKDFIYGTSKYQIISLTLYPSQNYSECEAIYIGEL